MRAGLPRPRDSVYGLPVPFTAAGLNMIGSGSDERIQACIDDALCSVCGLSLGEKCFVAVVSRGPHEGQISKLDPGLTHPKCAKMVKAFCPHFRDGGARMVEMRTAQAILMLRSDYSNGLSVAPARG